MEPLGIEAQPSAPGLPSATEVPQVSVWCSNTHDHLDDGMSCDKQNVMSTSAAGMHKPGRQDSPHSSTGSVRGSGVVKPDASAEVDSAREQPVHVLEQHQGQAHHQAVPAHAHDEQLAQPCLQTEQDGWDDSNPHTPFALLVDSKPSCKSSCARHRRCNRKPHLGSGRSAQISVVPACQDE